VELLRRLPGTVAELPGLADVRFDDALREIFPRLRIIFVRRRDKVPQAVSLWKAIQTQQWRTDSEVDDDGAQDPPSPTVGYDFEAIQFLLDQLHRWDARWEDWFHATGREPIRVFYEEFVDTRAATIGRVLDDLGIDPPEPPGQRMKRQADDVSRDWVSRFRHDADAQLHA
jgi:LPS sulfotransferase NodH